MTESDSNTQDEIDQLADRAARAREALGYLPEARLVDPMGAALSGVMSGLAVTLARQNKLVDGSGSICCWNCGCSGALLPGLHCDRCRRDALERWELAREVERTEHPETKRWRAIHRDMTEDQRLNQESAESLIRKCEKLPSATAERKSELQRRFDERFGQRREQARSYGGKGFRGRPAPDQWEGSFEDR